VLKDKISDHQATLTSFKIATKKLVFEIHKINHHLLFKTLEYNCPQLILTDAASFDQAAANLELTFDDALSLATKKYKITKPNAHSIEIPQDILALIRTKRKARRNMTRHNTPHKL